MALRRRPGLIYTAQDVARFCEVDLKTVHHWAERGRVPHHRTEGRHLRFRRNDLVRFLRAHGYPLPEEITSVRPRVMVAITHDELDKKLSARFSLRRFDRAVHALARLMAEEPDAVVLSLDDDSFGALPALAALKSDPGTSWIAFAVVTAAPDDVEAARTAGADVAIPLPEILRVAPELAKALAAS